MLLIANMLYPVLALISMILLAHRRREGFLLLLVVEVLMFYIGMCSGQMGISTMAVIYCFTNIYSYKKWSKL